MEIINIRYESLTQALATLQESIEFLKIYTIQNHPQLH